MSSEPEYVANREDQSGDAEGVRRETRVWSWFDIAMPMPRSADPWTADNGQGRNAAMRCRVWQARQSHTTLARRGRPMQPMSLG